MAVWQKLAGRYIALLGVVIGCLLAPLFGVWIFGSSTNLRDFMAGRYLTTNVTVVELTSTVPDATMEVPVELKNVSLVTVTVLGAQSDCGCIVATDLPFKVRPLQQKTVRFVIEPPSGVGEQHMLWRTRFITDKGYGPVVRFIRE